MQLNRDLAVFLLVLIPAVSQEPADPISDRLRYEIAAAQRDVLIVRQQFDGASQRLKDKMAQAETACAQQGATFDLVRFACAPKEKTQ